MKKVIKGSLLTILILTISISLIYFLGGTLTGFATYNQADQTEFDLGTYSNTVWNTDHVELASGQTSGTYTSKVFDATASATWNSLSYISTTPNLEILFAVDGVADIFKSTEGISWNLVKDDYNAGDGNGATYMVKNSSGSLFILFNQDLWTSEDSGVNWNKVNDDFNGGGDSNNGLVIDIDSNDYVYIIDGSKEVFKSTDSGATFTSINESYNLGGLNAKGMAIDDSDNLYAVDGTADVWQSTDSGITWAIVKDDYNAGIGNDATDMAADSSGNLFILHNQDVWQSTNSGTDWILINDDFNGGGDSNSGIVIFVDDSDNIYIVDGSEDVFKSTDSGASFSLLVSDYNGANGNIFGLSSSSSSSSLSFQIQNCSSADCSDGTWETISDLSDIGNVSQYFQYKVTFTSPDSIITPELSSITLDYDLVNQAPSVNLVSPLSAGSYGISEEISLNYSVSDSDNNLDSCWYTLDAGVTNLTLADCANSTLSGLNAGSHTLNLYANDSLSLEASDSSTFEVINQAPTVSIVEPQNTLYLSNESLALNFIATDADDNLDSCWYNLDAGENTTLAGCANTTFDTSEGSHTLNLFANDSLGLETSDSVSFDVDATGVSITITEPTGTKTSRTGIALTYTTVGNDLSCLYNVETSIGGEVIANTTLTNCSSSSFNVASDGDFVVNLFVNNLLGSSHSDSSSFSVDTSGGTVVINTGGGGGGGSSTKIITTNETKESAATFQQVPNIITEAGETKQTSIQIKNSGNTFLNNCNLLPKGEHASWISISETKGFAEGEIQEVPMKITIPSQTATNSYGIPLTLKCEEFETTTTLTIEILEKLLLLDIIQVTRGEGNNVDIIYSIEELSGIDQEIKIEFIFYNEDSEKVTEATETKIISANSKQEFQSSVPVEDSARGSFNLLINLNSEEYSTFVQEEVILSKSISGFALFNNEDMKDNVFSGAIILVFLAFLIIIIRRVLKHKKKVKK